MTYARNVDANQAEIVRAAEKCGAVVTPLFRLGGGVPDLLISFRQRWMVWEVKTATGKLKQSQKDWIAAQRAPVYVVTSAVEAVGLLQGVR